MIQNLFNPQGFYWFMGVVENRKDPLKSGRCKVRVFGDHSSNKEELPTEDLPWAVPMNPINSASMSGVGSAPIGPIEGTWVVGWYLDGADKQMPMMIGTVGASSVPAGAAFSQKPEREPLANPHEQELKDNAQNNPNNSNPLRKEVAGWSLGKTSEKYESGGKGPGVINDYNGASAGDLGGASYGCYQFASNLPPLMSNGKARNSATNSSLVQYIRNSRFKSKLMGLKPATTEFDAAWKAIAKEYPQEFKEDQHLHIKKNYYDVLMSNLKRCGIDLSNYGPAVQDLVWSTAVQLGPGKTEVFVTPLKGKSNLTEAEIVNLVSDYKLNKVPVLFARSTDGIRQGVSNRYAKEKKDLLGMIT